MTNLKWTALLAIGVTLMAVSLVIAASDPSPTNGEGTAVEPQASDETVGGVSNAGESSSAEGTEFITYLTVFVLAIFVGFEVITKVPPTLHTPLMSGSNAISGITIIGALLLAGAIDDGSSTTASHLAKIMAFVAVIFATINVVGGYLVTDRMLRMFKRK